MKDTPLYEVRKIRDLRDMLRQSTDLYGDQTAFMIKRMRGGPYENITMREFANDVDALERPSSAGQRRQPGGDFS